MVIFLSPHFTQASVAFENSAPVDDAHLAFLGDVFAVPAGWPLANVFSIGDVLIVIGAVALVHGACRPDAEVRTLPGTYAHTDRDRRSQPA